MAGRPKVSTPKLPVPGRLSSTLHAKFYAIAAKERRRPAELVSLVLEDYIAAYEGKNGPVELLKPAS